MLKHIKENAEIWGKGPVDKRDQDQSVSFFIFINNVTVDGSSTVASGVYRNILSAQESVGTFLHCQNYYFYNKGDFDHFKPVSYFHIFCFLICAENGLS